MTVSVETMQVFDGPFALVILGDRSSRCVHAGCDTQTKKLPTI